MIIKKTKIKLFIAAVFCLLWTSCNTINILKMKNESNSLIFPKGEKLSNDFFSGDAYLNKLLSSDKNNDFALGNVTFEAGARTNWHKHPKGQILIITDGEGLYQEKGKPAQHIKKGDIINIPENVEHWHGATATCRMIHIAITNYVGKVNVTWLEPVSDQEYNEANKNK